MKELTREEFLKGRNGIGGSTAGKILGVSNWGGPADAYDEIVSVLDDTIDTSKPMTPDQERGTLLEDVARQKYKAVTGRYVRRKKQVQHPEYKFLHANVDGLILGEHEHDGTGVLELKCPRYSVFQDFKDHGLRPEYVVQIQHNMNVLGLKWGSFGVFHADSFELVHFDCAFDAEFTNETLMPRLVDFWADHIEPRRRPHDTPGEPVDVPKLGGDYDVVDSDVALQIGSTFAQAKYEIKKWTAVLEESKKMVRQLSPESSGIEIPGLLKAKVRDGVNRLDTKAIEAFFSKHDIDIEQFRRRGTPWWAYNEVKRKA